MKKLLAAVAVFGFAVAGVFGASPAQACDDGANVPTESSLPSPTGGTIWYSTADGSAGVTVTGSQGYIEAREEGEGVEIGGRSSNNAVYGQVNTDNPSAICLPA